METKTFKHSYKGTTDVQGITGFQNAIREVFNYLAEVTQFNPEKRFIDAVPLLDLIGNTNAELAQVLSDMGDVFDKQLAEMILNENY